VAPAKDPGAFKTIGELSAELGVAQHILRYWESKFPELRPLQRAGNRRYYRPADVDLARLVHRLLTVEGYTMKGAQKLVRDRTRGGADTTIPAPLPATVASDEGSALPYDRLVEIRDRLSAALAG
jgi:DNA-binding transcriptional MerR regulator